MLHWKRNFFCFLHGRYYLFQFPVPFLLDFEVFVSPCLLFVEGPGSDFQLDVVFSEFASRLVLSALLVEGVAGFHSTLELDVTPHCTVPRNSSLVIL